MEIIKPVNSYYERIIDLILRSYDHEFSNASEGHCMKITGFGISEIEHLWNILNQTYPSIDSFIVSDEEKDGEQYITATKLIEYRNKQAAPLLVLIPSNSRTAAEDSYGNATFKEISLDGIDHILKNELIDDIPETYKRTIKEDIFQYLGADNLSNNSIINYLIELIEQGFSKENIGDFIFHLNLMPDRILIYEEEKTRSRLNFNLKSIESLSLFSKPLYDRIQELPLEPNTLQQELVQFLKNENKIRSKEGICHKIFEDYPNLNFSNWLIPELDFDNIKLHTEELRSNNMVIEEGVKVLRADPNSPSKIRIRFNTNPPPKDLVDLKYFKIILMAVDGGAGEEISTLRKLKNSTSSRPYREAIVELNPNMIEEGSYFFKVIAEDEHGNILNSNDDFRESTIQKAWEEAKEEDDSIPKSSFNYKLTCDSEDFDYLIDEDIDRPENQRKDKLNNILQAYFKFRIEKLKSDNELDIPTPSETSNIWLNPKKISHTSTFHINFSEKHNYQVNISTKLKLIEECILENSGVFGQTIAKLKNYSSAAGLEECRFIPSVISDLIPSDIKKIRKDLFEKIKASNDGQDCIFETSQLFLFIKELKEFVSKFQVWSSQLKEKIESEELTTDEQDKLQHLLTELQYLDIVKVRTKLPDGKSIDALLLSPLHPLRLSWVLQLYEKYSEWESKTIDYPNYRADWTNNLDLLFEGALYPENNPFVLVEPSTFKNFHYVGELTYGWGLYLNILSEESQNGMTSISRQLVHYFRQIFNIPSENYIETDVNQKLVIRHIRNYLAQHPYTDKLIINLINAGDADVFAKALVELEKEHIYQKIKYEIRIFKGIDRIISHGESLKELLNPDSNVVSEEAEAFSQPSQNRLFPKLRFSINLLNEYLIDPSKYSAHISFLINPFPVKIELVKPKTKNRSFHLNGLITESTISVIDSGNEIKWNRYIEGNDDEYNPEISGSIGIELFKNFQKFISGALASRVTNAIPSTQLRLKDKDKVLLSHLHDFSDWVITFDKNLGPQIYDQPSKDGKIPFLLDYIPGGNISSLSSFLTTRPSSEILGLLGPHFEEFDIYPENSENNEILKVLLEDVRAISSSLILQLNSSKNKAFEVVGSAFTKRVLEKKGFLEESFLLPIDLHQNLFDNSPTESRSRADSLLVHIDSKTKEILITVIEIKCRKAISDFEKIELKDKIKEQIQNTIEVMRSHFDPEYHISYDRLDREIKNKELKSLLSFYIERAYRYNYLSEKKYNTDLEFLQKLNDGFKFKFKQLGLIFDFSASKRHEKESEDSELTFFTFGEKVIGDILDPVSDLNTRRLEEKELDEELSKAIGTKNILAPLLQKLKPITEKEESLTSVEENTTETSTPDKESTENDIPFTIILKKTEEEGQEKSSMDTTPSDIVDNPQSDPPTFDILIGKGSESNQYGIIGESIHGRKIAIDLSETNTISLFGVQGGGKSYTIGTIAEMVIKHFRNINELPSPLAGVIFHYSESMDYEPEFTSMIYPNDSERELLKLKTVYGADPDNIKDVIILTPRDKIEERQSEFPSIQVLPIAFNSNELNVQDWMFLLGAVGNDSTYIKQLKAIMKEHRRNITLDGITESVETSELLTNTQKALARQKLNFAREYIDDTYNLRETLKPGRLIIVDLRDEFIVKDEALGLFVIMLNIFSGVKKVKDKHFNKFIVFDEAHKYMDNKDLTGNIVTSIREMRHKGVSIMIASQDPPSLPNEIIELSSIVLLHKFNSPQWLKHIQKSVTQLNTLTPADMSVLNPGEGFLWATKATDKSITTKPVKVSTRPRVTKHGGGTIRATGI